MSKKVTFNDHLDDAMERLMNENLSGEELKIEISRSKALSSLVDRKIEELKIKADLMIAMGENRINPNFIPVEFAEIVQNQIENKKEQ